MTTTDAILLPDRLDLLGDPLLTTSAARGRDNPADGWSAVTELVLAAVRGRGNAFPAPAGICLSPVDGDPATWYLDGPPTPNGVVALATPGLDESLVWQVHPTDDVEVTPVELPRGMAVWGLWTVQVHGRPLTCVADTDPVRRPNPASAFEPGVLAVIAAGAHALGVAARFRDAFVRKAAGSARGWSAVKTIDDPMVLKALQHCDGRLDGAAALLSVQAARARTASMTASVRADVHQAAMAAVDAATSATTSLMTFAGASALYTGNAMQESLAHIAALGTHPLFARTRRLHTTRMALQSDVERLSDMRSTK